jgi:hypothetical protein
LLGLRHVLLRNGRRIVWLGILLVVVVACPILVFEGGGFVLPAAVALLLADALNGRSGRMSRVVEHGR